MPGLKTNKQTLNKLNKEAYLLFFVVKNDWSIKVLVDGAT